MLKKYWFYIIAILSFIALGSALIAEFYFNLAPCEMCLKQREPYYVIIISFVFIALLKMANTNLVLSYRSVHEYLWIILFYLARRHRK